MKIMCKVVRKKLGLLLLATAWLSLMWAGRAWAVSIQVLPSDDEEILVNDKAIYVAGRYLPLSVAPCEENGSILVPLRAVSTALGAEVLWQDGQVQINQGEQKIVLRPGSRQALVNGQAVQMQVAPQMRYGYVFVPLRFVGEQLGAEVSYFDFIIDIEPAEGQEPEIALWSGGLPNGPEANCAEDEDYIYLAVWDKAAQVNQIKRFDKQTLTETVLQESGYCYGLQLWDGGLYFNADGNLTRLDLQTNVCELVQEATWRFSVYNGWLYWFNSADKVGADLVLQRRPLAGGEAQQVTTGPLLQYWFAGDKLYYNHYDIKTFCADLDGQNAVKLPEAIACYDAGWKYFTGGSNNNQLYRCHEDGSDKQLLLELEDDYAIWQVKAVGSKLFFSTHKLVYVDGRSDWLSGPLFYVDLASKNYRQLLDGRCGDFYILRQHCVCYSFDDEQWHIIEL